MTPHDELTQAISGLLAGLRSHDLVVRDLEVQADGARTTWWIEDHQGGRASLTLGPGPDGEVLICSRCRQVLRPGVVSVGDHQGGYRHVVGSPVCVVKS